MERDRVPFLVCVTIAIAALAVGIWKEDMVAFGISLLAVTLSAFSAAYCDRRVFIYSLVACTVTLICVILMTTVASEVSMVEEGTVSRYKWRYVASIILVTAIVPLIMLFYFTIAAVFGAIYNWALVSAFCPFIGMGMTVPGYALIFFTQRSMIDRDLIQSGDVIMSLMIAILAFVIFAIIIGYVFMRKRYLISKNGLEVMR
ncbi:MAG: hypothetical protein LBE48_00390 [Methanomassiliicoccaceae archaeon]|jgi:hypothetical protein|nr:hypothetical protein [Methanomassiliicoccaceae archaeon]